MQGISQRSGPFLSMAMPLVRSQFAQYPLNFVERADVAQGLGGNNALAVLRAE